jgi:hypothetical protein
MSQNDPVFDSSYWRQRIDQPDWYMELIPYLKKTSKATTKAQFDEFTKEVRSFFEEQLLAGKVALSESGPNLDDARMPVDTIVIHHTSWRPGYRLSFMEAVQLLNIYARYYMNPTLREERGLRGQPIWSNHFKDGRQTFLCYHWLMRMDGSFERLLPDEALGWHAGDWQVNRRSVAICLDNDYEGKDPAPEVLEKLAKHIKKHYPAISPSNVIGHRECRQGTICPGRNFNKWKPLLLENLR